MTRQGTLAYYLAAWVIGGFFVALAGWVIDVRQGEPASAARFLTGYFLVLIFGAVDCLLFAFLLRRVMRLLRAQATWVWFVTGAVVATVLVLILVRVAGFLLLHSDEAVFGYVFKAVLVAPSVLRLSGLWQVPIEGAATGAVLSLIDRAFGMQPASEPRQSAV